MRLLCALTLLAVAALSSGCGGGTEMNGTALVVDVDTDLRAGELDEIVVTATPARGSAVVQRIPVQAPLAQPVRLALIPEGAPDFDVDVVAEARRGGSPVVSAHGRATFSRDVKRLMQLFLNRRCQMGMAPTCGAEQVCGPAGTCVAPEQAFTVVDFTGQPPGNLDAGVVDARPAPDAPAGDARTDGPVPVVDARPQDGPADASPDGPIIIGNWTVVPTAEIPPNTVLNSVWPVSATEVWVAGQRGASGVIFRFDGRGWAPAPVPPSTQALYGIWASTTNTWAVGLNGVVLRRVGNDFLPVAVPARADFTSVWGASEREVWIVGGNGLALRWDGANVIPAAEGLTGLLTAVTGSPEGQVLAVGPGGAVWRRAPTRWERLPQQMTMTTLLGVWAGANVNVWAVGIGEAINFNGARWTLHPLPGNALAVWGASDNEVWLVGATPQSAVIGRWTGERWVPVPLPQGATVATLQSIRGLSATDIWAVGSGGTVLRYRR